MRTHEAAVKSWLQLDKYASLPELRAALEDPAESPTVSSGLRSACWKAFLLFETSDRSLWPSKLRSSREAYVSLRKHFLRAIEHPDEWDATGGDPLSDSTDSPWHDLRKDEAVRQEILLDVERCMPENLYFRQPSTQNLLQDILFIWTKLNPDVGYRQGMHEVLAPILWVIERDAIDPANIKKDAQLEDTAICAETFDASYVGHDTFTLFNVVMRGIKVSYDQSIVSRSRSIVDDLVMKTDPGLAAHLLDIDIAPQIFVLRWIRLLFGREFAFDDLLCLWDRIFTTEPLFEYIDLVCCTILLRKRWQLVKSDYNQALALLLQSTLLSEDQPASSLMDDAIYLKTHLNADGGRMIVTKYTGQSPPPLTRPGTPSSQGRTSIDGSSEKRRWRGGTPNRSSQPSPSIESLVQDAARGVFSRGERLGINKAVRDAVSEVRKNVQGLQSMSRPHSRQTSTLGSAIDFSDQTKSDMLQRIEALETRNKSLGRMLEGAVDDLWQQQNEIVKVKSPEDEQVQSLTRAIAKVQFVQVYLQDSSLPLVPEDTAAISTQKSDQPIDTTKDGVSQHKVPAQQDVPQAEETPPNNPSAGSSSPRPAREQGREEPMKQEVEPQRPTLAKSQFSWMLGQDESAGSSSLSASNTLRPPENLVRSGQSPYRSSNAFLFGDSPIEDLSEESEGNVFGNKGAGNAKR